MNLSTIKDLAVITGTAIALITFVKAVIEYTRENAQKRAEHYQLLRDKFRDDEQIRTLYELLETDSPKLRDIPFQQKQHLIGFYEDIALSLNSGLLKPEVAHYMFAYYALRCWESENFWCDVNKESPYWSLFKEFVTKMKIAEAALVLKPAKTSKYKL